MVSKEDRKVIGWIVIALGVLFFLIAWFGRFLPTVYYEGFLTKEDYILQGIGLLFLGHIIKGK